MIVALGAFISLGAWLGGRAIARWLAGVPGVRLMSKGADESYFRASPSRRLAFRLAGPVTTYLVVAALCFLWLRASGDRISTTTVDVVPDGPAATAGMQSGDRIVVVDGVAPRGWQEILDRVRAAGPGRRLSFQVRRDDGEHTIVVTPNADGKVRISPRAEVLAKPVGRALAEAAVMPLATVVHTARTQYRQVTGAEYAEMLGPVGIVREVSKSDGSGDRRTQFLLSLLAFPSAIAWPLSPIVELLLSPRRPRRHL